MTAEPVEPPVEERLAQRLESRPTDSAPARRMAAALHLAGRADRALYRHIARLSAPALDAPLRRVSRFANHSKPWFLAAAVLAVLGGRSGRRAAVTGVAAVAATSLVVNQPMKWAGGRRRPDRETAGVPSLRWVGMPDSPSFPSGHSASAAAFAVAVGSVVPPLRLPLGVAAAVVGFSRVYTGVHYPGDVAAGAAVGVAIGTAAARAGRRIGSPPH